jgi:TM2 domain-containing membrane protein YozV
MYCRNCGNGMDNNAVVCVSCGVPKGTGNKYCQNCGVFSDPMAQICVKCGVQLGAGGSAQKSKLVAGMLGIFIGSLGIHRFYLGYTGMGIIQIAVTVCTCGAGGLWGFIEGILILCGKGITTDKQGNPLKD